VGTDVDVDVAAHEKLSPWVGNAAGPLFEMPMPSLRVRENPLARGPCQHSIPMALISREEGG